MIRFDEIECVLTFKVKVLFVDKKLCSSLYRFPLIFYMAVSEDLTVISMHCQDKNQQISKKTFGTGVLKL